MRQVFKPHALGKTDGHRAFNRHRRLGVDGPHVLDHRLHRGGVEKVGDRVVIGRGGNDDKVCVGLSLGLVQRGVQVECLVSQVVGDVGVLNGGAPLVEQRHHLVVLGQQNSVGKADVAGAGNGDFCHMMLC
jgi:hypothetical protein